MYEAFFKNAFSLVYFSKQRFSSLFALKLNRKGEKKKKPTEKSLLCQILLTHFVISPLLTLS